MSREWQLPVPMLLVDIASQTREMHGADKAREIYPNLPETDWRFEARLPSGAIVTFSRDTTAAHIAPYLKREGVEIPPVDLFAELNGGGDPA